MSKFTCAIYIDSEDTGYSLDIIDHKNLYCLYEKIATYLQIQLREDTKPVCNEPKSINEWIQKVCNKFEFCNVHYKITYMEEGFICKEN